MYHNQINNNPYIHAVELGIENIKTGISYKEIIKHLESKGWRDVDNDSFRKWFYNSFFLS